MSIKNEDVCMYVHAAISCAEGELIHRLRNGKAFVLLGGSRVLEEGKHMKANVSFPFKVHEL